MKKLLIIAALMMLATSAFAAVQNVKISGDITTYGVGQYIYDLDDDIADVDPSNSLGDENNFFATITRLRVDADLTDNVAATIRFANEREWDAACTSDSEAVQLDLAYITLKEIFYSPLTVTMGRQDLAYGSKLVIGDPNTNATVAADSNLNQAAYLSKMKAFDAIVGVLDYDPWTLDVVYAKIDETFEVNAEDVDVLGLNIAYDFADYEAEIEGYVFNVDGEKSSNAQDITVYGLRGSLAPVDGLTVGGEIAIQTGDYSATRSQDAMAATVEGSYVWDNEYAPMVKLCYDYRSGEKAANTGDYEAWEPLYEDQTKGLIADYLFSGVNGGVNSNASIISLSGSINPTEDLTIGIDWFNYTLDEKISASAIWSAPMLGQSINTDKDDLGNEIDLTMTYDYTEDVVVGLQAGWFMPGDIFATANDDDAYALVGSIAVSF